MEPRRFWMPQYSPHLPQFDLQLHSRSGLLHLDQRGRINPVEAKDGRTRPYLLSNHEHHLWDHR